jgi:predicted Zn-dependent peptidase
VLEEWRANRNAAGRASDLHWEVLMRGSKIADRMPIGLESVIRGVPADTVKTFYTKWYHPAHMAVVAVGDFQVRWAAALLDPTWHGVPVRLWPESCTCLQALSSARACLQLAGLGCG